jgi:predicted transcriptional regulator
MYHYNDIFLTKSNKINIFDKQLPISWYSNMKIEELGKQIKHRRKVLGLTVRQLAELTGMSKTTISQIEMGIGNPTFEVLQNIFEYLNLEIKVVVKQT